MISNIEATFIPNLIMQEVILQLPEDTNLALHINQDPARIVRQLIPQITAQMLKQL